MILHFLTCPVYKKFFIIMKVNFLEIKGDLFPLGFKYLTFGVWQAVKISRKETRHRKRLG